MSTNPEICASSSESLSRAAKLLREGKLVSFPTETVYGLGGDATNEQAIAKIYAAKGRPQFNPLIVHIAETRDACQFVKWNDAAEKVAAAFWPGPLTLVLPRTDNSPVALLGSAGLTTIAIRCPAHKTARALIRESGLPIAAPSANASGQLSPTQAEHVAESLGANVDLILDGGPCAVGVESTVLDLTTETPTILRHGGVTKEMLAALLGTVREALHDEAAPKSPGMLLSHYAPKAPVRIDVTEAREHEAYLVFGDDTALKGGQMRLNLSPSGNLTEAAANLFSMLHVLDHKYVSAIAVAPIPHEGLGAAINDRLARAAAK